MRIRGVPFLDVFKLKHFLKIKIQNRWTQIDKKIVSKVYKTIFEQQNI